MQIKVAMVTRELWDYVTGAAPDPGDDAAAKEVRRKAEDRAMAILILSIRSNLLYLVTLCEKPKEVCDTLSAQFERKTLSSKILLKRQYFTTKMRDGQPVQEHLKNLKEITDKLAALGSAVTEEEQVVALLISLP